MIFEHLALAVLTSQELIVCVAVIVNSLPRMYAEEAMGELNS